MSLRIETVTYKFVLCGTTGAECVKVLEDFLFCCLKKFANSPFLDLCVCLEWKYVEGQALGFHGKDRFW